jgi:ABC-2 type transport system ATP-binding protein
MIVIDNLSKRYGATTAVKDVSFTCRPGTVTGFLGPNGAGKSTTLRMLCGLATPAAGRALVLGLHYRDLQQPGRTGRESLILAGDTLGVPRGRVDDVLGMVGLDADAARRRIGRYSLGMRQRLGLAHALLGDPQVLILDEPANGLDPAGIAWMRDLLRHFADDGGTVLLSSHLLGEVQAIADQLVIIAGGSIVARGSAADLLSASGLVVRATDDAALLGCLDRAGFGWQPTATAHSYLVQASAEQVGSAAASAGVVLVELREPDAAGLEELFLALTSRSTPEGSAA